MSADKYKRKQLNVGNLTDEHITAMVRIAQARLGLKVDGFCGSKTLRALVKNPKSKVPLIVRVAAMELGNGEEGSNNSGRHIQRYRMGMKRRGGGEWCAAFVSYCLHRSGYATKIQPALAARAIVRNITKAGGTKSRVPSVGSVALWARGAVPWHGHVGIVSRIEGDRVWVIEGNIGKYPAKVAEREVTNRRRLIGYFSLPAIP